MGKETSGVVIEELLLGGARLKAIGRTKGKLEEVQECAHDLLLSYLGQMKAVCAVQSDQARTPRQSSRQPERLQPQH
jgi:hypothetical protein